MLLLRPERRRSQIETLFLRVELHRRWLEDLYARIQERQFPPRDALRVQVRQALGAPTQTGAVPDRQPQEGAGTPRT